MQRRRRLGCLCLVVCSVLLVVIFDLIRRSITALPPFQRVVSIIYFSVLGIKCAIGEPNRRLTSRQRPATIRANRRVG
jgi:hypothetical protein